MVSWQVFLVVFAYTGLLLGIIRWMFNAQTKQIQTEVALVKTEVKAQIEPINKKLDNHITETNKKIDLLSNRFENLSNRFDRLYELLLKDKKISDIFFNISPSKSRYNIKNKALLWCCF